MAPPLPGGRRRQPGSGCGRRQATIATSANEEEGQMTTKPKTRKAKAPARAPKRRRARDITEAEAAAMDFEPWQGDVDTKKLPNNEQFTENGLCHLITCRMALVMMYRTKAELSGMFEQNGDAMCVGRKYGKCEEFFLALFRAS
jgi:hypothetical protein